MFTAICALGGSVALAQEPTDRIAVQAHPHNLELAWADTEDRLRGTVTPGRIHAGDAVRVVLDVGSYDGKPFDGPVTLQLRQPGALHGESVTVQNQSGWHAEFHPVESGSYSLDLSFRTTRLKVLHAAFEVAPTTLPTAVWWGLTGAAAAAAAAYFIYARMRPKKPIPA